MNERIPANSDLLFHATGDIGIKETPGEGQTSAIMKWLRGAGITWGGDETHWCSAWLYDVVGRVPGNLPRPAKRRAAAASWEDIGEEVALADAIPGDIVVFDRGKGRRHVGLFTRNLGKRGVVSLGGNQGDAVRHRVYTMRVVTIRRLYPRMAVAT